MKRSRRPLLLIFLLLLGGAVVNVLVAWAAVSSTVTRDPDWYLRLGLTPYLYYRPPDATDILAQSPALGGMTPPELAESLIIEAWKVHDTRSRDQASGAFRAAWPVSPPAGWPAHCLRVDWSSRLATWSIGYQCSAGPRSQLIAHMIDTYRVGWPLRSLELRSWYAGISDNPAPEELSGFNGLPAPRILTDRGLFNGAAGRIPTRPLPAGFLLNTLFYTALLALPLTFFPLRRHLRTRRGRCPKCGYDLVGLADTRRERAAPCPECGVAP